MQMHQNYWKKINTRVNNFFVNRNEKCLMNIGQTILTSTIKERQIKWSTREFFNHDIHRDF